MHTFVEIITALFTLGLIVFVVVFSFWLLEEFNIFYGEKSEDSRILTIKIILFIPWMLLFVWCIAIAVLGGLLIAAGMANVLTEARNWWHKGK